MGSKRSGTQLRDYFSPNTDRSRSTNRGAEGRRALKRRCSAVEIAIDPLEKRVLFSGFVPGDLAVERLGVTGGSVGLSSSTQPVYIDEFNTTGVAQSPTYTVPLPSTSGGASPAQNALVDTGTTSTSGYLTRSADGQYLVLTGYNEATNLVSATGTAVGVQRVVGLVNASGGINTNTSFGTATTTGTVVRGIASYNGSSFYVSGTQATSSTAAGIQYVILGGTTSIGISQTSTGQPTNLRADVIYNGQLYVDGDTGTGSFYGPGTVGTGLPTTAGGSLTTVLPGFASNPGAANQFVFDGPNTIYVADSDTSNTYLGGIQKWQYAGGAWYFQYNSLVTGGTTADSGLLGLAIDSNGVLYGTTTASGQNRLVQITDNGPTAQNFSFGTLATAPVNEMFHGVALTPQGAGISKISAAPSSIQSGATINLSANVAETGNSGTVTGVNFYLQSGATQSSSDTLLGAGTLTSGNNTSGGTWTLSKNTSALSLSVGTHAFYAVAADTNGLYTGITGTQQTASVLVNQITAPVITSITVGSSTSISGGIVTYGGTVPIVASGVSTSAAGDTVTSVSFYRQVGGAPSTSADVLLGTVLSSGSGYDGAGDYTLNYEPSRGGTGYNISGAGTYTVYAVATTSMGAISQAAVSPGGLTVTVATVAFNQSTTTVSEVISATTASSITLEIDRSVDLTDAATVLVSTTVGPTPAIQTTPTSNASAGTNYTTYNANASFAANATSAFISIPILFLKDTGTTDAQGGFKVFTATLSSPVTISADANSAAAYNTTGGVLGSNSKNIVTIQDYTETINLSSSSVVVSKNNASGVIEFSVTRTGFLGDSVSLTYNTSDGTAISGTNYTGNTTPQNLTFGINQSVAVISIPTLNTSNQSANLSFNVSIQVPSGLDSAGTGYLIPGGTLLATGTIVNTDATQISGTSNAVLTGVGATADVETSGTYFTSFADLVGDGTGGAGSTATSNSSFGYATYEVLEYSFAATPSLYPQLGTTITASTGISALSFELYNADASGPYKGNPGNFNIYYLPDSDLTTPTGTLAFSTLYNAPTGITTKSFTATPVLLGTFSFSNNSTGINGATSSNGGYDIFTPASSTSLATVETAVITALNNDANFRFALTPTQQGNNSVAADWAATQSNEQPLLVLAAHENVASSPEYIAFNQSSYSVNESAGTATIQIDRSATLGGSPYGFTGTATVSFTTSNGSATAGTNYTATSGVATFNSGSGTAYITIPITNVTNQGGDKTLNLSLSSPTTSTSGYIAGSGTQSTATLVIVDSLDATTTRSETLTATSSNNSEVEVKGPFSNQLSIIGSASIGKYDAYGVIDFNDPNGGGPTPTFAPAYPVTAITGITVSVFDLGSGAAGPIDFYLVPDSTSNINPAVGAVVPNPHFFNSANYLPEGLDTNPSDYSSFGIPMLLGQYNWNPATATPDTFIQVPLTGFNQATENMLINDLNNNLKFRIVVTPENPTVYANWGGTASYDDPNNPSAPAVYEAPQISFNLTEQNTAVTGLPAWLAQNSQATYSNGSLVITGAATIIGDPGNSEPNITFTGTGDVLTIDPPPGSEVHIGSLNISGGAKVDVVAPVSESDLLIISSASTGLSIDATSQLDLGSSDMIVQAGSLSNVSSEIGVGYNSGAWNGLGIISSTAAANSSHLTTLGVITNTATLYSSFDGVAVSAGDVLVKYTYYGDTNLDGKVDGSDYSRIDNGALNHLTGWFNGDFNFDSVLNGSDYTLIDNAYNTQGALIPAQVAASIAAQIATPTAVFPAATTAISTDSLFSKKKVKHSSYFDDLVLN